MANPTPDPNTGAAFDKNAQPVRSPDDQRALDITRVLLGYKQEAEDGRKGGPNGRDDKWKQNLDLYWNRYDFSKKANWQAKETLPEVPKYVDRFAAALKEALVATPEGFYTVKDPSDKEGDIAGAIKRMTDVWLSQVGRSQVGTPLAFPAVFEEQMKLGALMACSSIVTWKKEGDYGCVSIETLDPRKIWLDPTFRNLYRIRRIEIDRHELFAMAKLRDSKGKPIYNLPEIERLMSGVAQQQLDSQREDLTGHGAITRAPIILDEYVATVVSPTDGAVIADKALMIVANDQYLIRGPEKNPFTHGKDWLLYTPLITTPLSVYGRSYMEDFGSIATTFTELTNMLLDAVHTSALKAWAMVPSALLNPAQINEGITPHKIFQLEDGVNPKDFAMALDMGTLPADAVKMWSALKQELGEAASMNELGIGQFAPNSRTSATEITEVQQSSSALIRSIAQTVETRHLDPTLDLVWKTGLQHASPKDEMLRRAAGPDMYDALLARKDELIKRQVTFQARGISALIQRSQMLKALMALLQIIAASEILLKKFFEVVDLDKLVQKLFELSGVDITTLQTSEREQMIRSVTEPMGAAQEAVSGAPPAQGAGADVVSGLVGALGVGK